MKDNLKIDSYIILRIALQGLPTAKLFDGMSFTTTLPAPMTHESPIVTPAHMTTLLAIQQSLPIVTGLAYSKSDNVPSGAFFILRAHGLSS